VGNEKVFQKLGKSLVANHDIKLGEKFTLENLSGRIFNQTYIPVRESNSVLGSIAKRDIVKGEPIQYTDFK
jgi:N-acetylneuraminate synthase/sialic acid synthase